MSTYFNYVDRITECSKTKSVLTAAINFRALVPKKNIYVYLLLINVEDEFKLPENGVIGLILLLKLEPVSLCWSLSSDSSPTN